jgi:hypothetical protein
MSRNQSGFRKWRGLGCAVAALAFAAAASADTIETLDQLAMETLDEARGIALAREQANRGEWLDALASLERVLAYSPKSAQARLLHAVYLCRVDDRLGAAVELEALRQRDYSPAQWDEALAECGVPTEAR